MGDVLARRGALVIDALIWYLALGVLHAALYTFTCAKQGEGIEDGAITLWVLYWPTLLTGIAGRLLRGDEDDTE